jgi:hypothetical protein
MVSRPQPPSQRWSIHLLPAALAVVLVLAPLPLGGVLPWSQTLLHLVAFVLLAGAALLVRDVRLLAPVLLPALAIAAIAALGALQSVASSPGPAIATTARTTEPAIADRPTVQPPSVAPGYLAIGSLAPGRTRAAALNWAAMAALLVVAAVGGVNRKSRRLIAIGIAASALFQVVLGARSLGRYDDTIFGIGGLPNPQRLRGTFVDPDHLATFLGLALPLVFAWAWWAIRHTRHGSTLERRLAVVAPPVLVWLTLFVGLAFTGSRAGLIAAVIAACLQGVLVAGEARRWRVSGSGAVAVAVGIGVVAVIGLQQGLGRWLGTSSYDLTGNQRLVVARSTLELWERFPWLGSGLATFREAYPLSPGAMQTPFWHAHNEYLELLENTGVVGALVVVAGLIALLLGLSAVLRRGERSEDRAAGLAAIGAVAAIAVHSAFDFGLSLPANAVCFVIIVGAAMSARLQHTARTWPPEGFAPPAGDPAESPPAATRQDEPT